MDFDLTPEQTLIQESIRKFLVQTVEPRIEKYESEEQFPEGLLQQMGSLGFLGLGFLPDYGGSGGGHVEVAILSEELSQVAGGVCSSVLTHMIGANMIAKFGTPAQKERYLPAAMEGRLCCAIAITEPDYGSDVAGLKTTAQLVKGNWILNGQKMFITNAGMADVFMVMARTNPNKGRAGISMILVDRDAPGLSIGKQLRKLGWHTSDTAPIHLDNCCVSEENLLGTLDCGFDQLAQGFIYERINMAAMGVGSAQAALDSAVTYAVQRVQFGQPIGKFQSIRHRLSDMKTETEAARQLTYLMAWNADQGRATPGGAAMAKLFATEVATRVAGQAVQVFGGSGFMAESKVSRIYRDVKILTIGGGTSEIMRSVISKEMGL